MLVAAMPGLTLAQAAVVCQSSTSVAMTLPGGGAIAVGVSYAMYSSWGFAPSDIALSTLLTGIVNMSFKFVLPVISLAVLAINGEWSAQLLSSALAGVGVVLGTFVVLAEMIRREAFAYRVGALIGTGASLLRRIVRMPPVTTGGDVAVRFRSKLIRVLRNRGLVPAVLVFRFLTYFVQIPIGGFTYAVWRRRHSWLRPRPASPQEQAAEHARQVEGPSDGDSRAGLVDHRTDRQDEKPTVPST